MREQSDSTTVDTSGKDDPGLPVSFSGSFSIMVKSTPWRLRFWRLQMSLEGSHRKAAGASSQPWCTSWPCHSIALLATTPKVWRTAAAHLPPHQTAAHPILQGRVRPPPPGLVCHAGLSRRSCLPEHVGSLVVPTNIFLMRDRKVYY